MSYVLPKDNAYLIGHKKAEEAFLKAYHNKNLHHAWLITGKSGVGKATFGYKIARFLLQENEQHMESAQTLDIAPNSQVFLQISSGSNPNFKVIEKDFIETDKKKIIKAIKEGEPLDDEALQGLKKSSVIKVDDVREIHSFLSKKSFDGAWRVVLIDSVDDLNQASANAILKILEEPPIKSILLLICHNPNDLLPTIKSRCSRLNLETLSRADVASLLRRYEPQLSEKEVNTLAEISRGSIGDALKYANCNALEVYQKIESVVYAGSHFNLKDAIDLASLGASDEEMFDVVLDLILGLMLSISEQEETAQCAAKLYQDISYLRRETHRLNMDKKMVLLNILSMITKGISDACR